VYYASTSDAAIAGLRSDLAKSAEKLRRNQFANRAKLLCGDYQDLVKDELRRIFEKQEQADRVALTGDSSLNVFRYVTEETYHYVGAKRAFKIGTSEDPVYARICKQLVPFDLIMGEVAIALGGLNDCLIQVLPGVERPGSVSLPLVRVFYPHECTVVQDPDDPSQAIEVRYETINEKGELLTVVWNATEHYVVGPSKIPMPGRNMNGLANPYGRLPFVAVHAGMRADSFWDADTGEDRYQFTLQWLAAWSSVRHLLHQQAHKQVVMKGVDQTDPAPAYSGPGAIWRVSSSVDVDVLDMSADPAPQAEALKTMLAGHLASHGLNPERLGMNPGQAPPSGLARFLERQELLERRKLVRPFLEEAEYELGELYRAMWNWNHREKISEEAEFEAVLIEESVVLSPLEQADLRLKQIEVIERERALGLRPEVEQFAEYNDLDLETAAQRMAAIAPAPAPEPEPEPEPAPEAA
jgi:hypothetical protein